MKMSNSETCNKKPLISLLVSRYHYQILEVGTVHQELDPQQRTTWHELESRRRAWDNETVKIACLLPFFYLISCQCLPLDESCQKTKKLGNIPMDAGLVSQSHDTKHSKRVTKNSSETKQVKMTLTVIFPFILGSIYFFFLIHIFFSNYCNPKPCIGINLLYVFTQILFTGRKSN